MAVVRVLHILEATGGGTARHVVDLCVGLAGQGVEVHLAYSPLRMDRILEGGLPLLRQSGVRLLELPLRRAPHPGDLKALLALRKYLKQAGLFDLVHGHSSKAGGLARLLRLLGSAKAVYTPHAFITLSSDIGDAARWVYGLVERGLSPLTSALIAVSEDEAREAIRLGYPREKVRIIPNAIDLGTSQGEAREEVRGRLGLGHNDLAVGFVGRFVPQKAPLILLGAFAKVAPKNPQARLVMVGDGPLKNHLKQRARELALEDRVIWPGFMDGRQAMRAFDIFALSSDYEGFPYVLLEAMAEGLPLVATRVGGTEMAIREGENGFVVPIGDIQGFAQSLDLLLSDTALRRRMGENSRIRVQQFTVDKMVEATLALYKELLQE